MSSDLTAADISRWVDLVRTLGPQEALKVQKQKMKLRKKLQKEKQK